MDFFRGLKLARECMLALCMHCVEVQRIRMLPSGVVVEIDRPLEIGEEAEIDGEYASVEFAGCRVAWKVSEKKLNE